MASSAPNKSIVGRLASVLTTAEVAATPLDLNNTSGGHASIDLSFTIGSLTNCVVRFYVSLDGVTYKPLAVNAAVISETLTASAERAYVFPSLGGWKFLRVSVQGSGTVTDSSCAISYRFLKRGAY